MVSFTTDSVNSKHYECSGTLDTDTWEYYLSCGDRKTEQTLGTTGGGGEHDIFNSQERDAGGHQKG